MDRREQKADVRVYSSLFPLSSLHLCDAYLVQYLEFWENSANTTDGFSLSTTLFITKNGLPLSFTSLSWTHILKKALETILQHPESPAISCLQTHSDCKYRMVGGNQIQGQIIYKLVLKLSPIHNPDLPRQGLPSRSKCHSFNELSRLCWGPKQSVQIPTRPKSKGLMRTFGPWSHHDHCSPTIRIRESGYLAWSFSVKRRFWDNVLPTLNITWRACYIRILGLPWDADFRRLGEALENLYFFF